MTDRPKKEKGLFSLLIQQKERREQSAFVANRNRKAFSDIVPWRIAPFPSGSGGDLAPQIRGSSENLSHSHISHAENREERGFLARAFLFVSGSLGVENK